jgi:hypothetical protein
MKLVDFYPAPDTLIQSECATLDYLMNEPNLNSEQPQFAAAARRLWEKIHKNPSHLAFESYLVVEHQGTSLKLFICGLIERSGKKGYGNISYCLTVGRPRRKGTAILRKFHFDVTAVPANAIRTQAHPVCHVQYCGELLPYLAENGLTQNQIDQMHPWLSEPRLFYWPMSLALVMDMALREFPTSENRKLREKSEWRAIVRANESMLLAEFHQRCLSVVQDKTGQKLTLADAFYVG